MNRFKDVPVEPDTRIIQQKEVEIKKSSMKDRFGPSAKETSISDINDMSISEALDLMTGVVEDYVESRLNETVETFSGPLDKRFQHLNQGQEKLAAAILEQAKRTGSMLMKSTHTDFETYQAEAYEYVTKYGIPLEEAYVIVKNKHKDAVPPRTESDVERPSRIPSRSTLKSARDEETETVHKIARSSTRKMRDITRAAVEKVMAGRQ